MPTQRKAKAAGTQARTGVSWTVIALAGVIGALHLFNFLNYSNLRELTDFPLIRAGLLITLAGILFVASARHFFGHHLARHWDIYAFCLICLATTAVSVEPAETLKYSLWLLLSCYAVLELGRHVKTIQEVQAALLIVIVPTALVSLAIYVTLGATVLRTGRVFGALGTAHVDVAIALGFALLLLAILSLIKDERIAVPLTLRWLALPLVPYAGYLIVFGLTRSVWLSFAIGVFLFLATNVRRAIIAGIGIVLAFLVVEVIGLAPVGLVPDAVQKRIELTEKRAETGEIDPRLRGIRFGLETAVERPEGYGYGAGVKTHNSYFDVLVGTGLTGFALMVLVMVRSAWLCSRMPAPYVRFFLIGSAGLLAHAFFETQATPGQADFIPVVTWLAMTRSTFVAGQQKTAIGKTRWKGLAVRNLSRGAARRNTLASGSPPKRSPRTSA